MIKEVLFVVGYAEEKGALIWPARGKLWGREFPVSTLVGVQALASPEALIEVEAIASLE